MIAVNLLSQNHLTIQLLSLYAQYLLSALGLVCSLLREMPAEKPFELLTL